MKYDFVATKEEMSEYITHLRKRIAELEEMLREATSVLEIYYVPNYDGSTPTIDRCHAILNKGDHNATQER